MGQRDKKNKYGDEDPFLVSPTPPEWDDHLEREWPIDRIVDHCIGPEGKFHYKIGWASWSRDDGTNTTWQPADTLEPHLIDTYWAAHKELRDSSQQSASRERTGENLYLESDVLTANDVHVLALPTIESKLEIHRRRKKKQSQLAEALDIRTLQAAVEQNSRWAEERFGINPVFANLRGRAEVENLRAPSTEPATASLQREPVEYIIVDSPSPDIVEIPRPPELSPFSLDPHPADMAGFFATTSHYDQERNDTLSYSTSGPDDGMNLASRRTQSDIEAKEEAQSKMVDGMARAHLQPMWDAATDLVSAARIKIIVPGEGPDDCPQLPLGFKYIEKDYITSPKVWNPESSSRLNATGCPCTGECDMRGNADCACQSHSAMDKRFAYSPKGIFQFNNSSDERDNVEVFECTNACSCSANCPNRTSQRPRDVPLEVFKTQKCGWGIRTPIALPKGKVVGVFTGRLITRARSEELENARREEWLEDMQEYKSDLATRGERYLEEDYPFLDRRGYIFDLDCGEQVDHDAQDDDNSDDEPPRDEGKPRYSVDAWVAGNWSRFLNHSCDPNVKVYTAITEPYHEENPPPGRLVFATMHRIRAGEELRIDYNPGLKGLGKGQRQKGSRNMDRSGSMSLKTLSKNSMVWPSPSRRSGSASAQVKGRRRVGSDGEMTLDGMEKTRDIDLKKDEVRCECDSRNCRVYIKV
ncbi:hypothetical protein FRB98_006630 [Tulasnella sp. 332]|nr:hypothetical protein FRB98_006630 [Tulasnella sp. 332]